MDIAAWLRSLGLEQYEQTFRDNAIGGDVLPALTDEHLKELGLPLGHRLKLLNAIAALHARASEQVPTEPIRPRPRSQCRVSGGRWRCSSPISPATRR